MESIISKKSYAFAIKIVNVYKELSELKREFILSKQMLRSGTAIGALTKEAEHAESKADFIHKMNFALKEANETQYWLNLLKDTGYLNKEEADALCSESIELIKILASIIKTSKKNSGKL